MSRAVPLHSTEAEIEALFHVCDRLSGFDARLSPFHLDGWLAALAAGPVRPPPELWLEAMCGDAFERTFADPPDRAQALAVLQRRLAVLHDMLDADALLDRPDELRLDPLFDEWSDDERRRMVEEDGVTPEQAACMQPGALWADGFLTGFDALRDAVWKLPQDESEIEEGDIGSLLEVIGALEMDPAGERFRQFVDAAHRGTAPERDLLLGDACMAVQDLRVALLDHAPRPETRRVAAQPGRNDPCPCGSGKKFKKCHGALA
jgi:uncharacterized protein